MIGKLETKIFGKRNRFELTKEKIELKKDFKFKYTHHWSCRFNWFDFY